MHLLPETLNAVKYRAFWENTDNPSLKKFLDFRHSAGDLEDMKTEYHRYSKELDTIGKFYAEVSEHGREVLRWKNAFKSDKKSAVIKRFWKLQAERQNVIGKIKLHEDRVNTRVKKKVQDLQASQHITIADVATEQIKHYARSTTTSITKRFLDCKERTVKRAKIHEDSNGDENNPFYVSGEKSSTDSPNDIADNTLLVSGEKSSYDDSEDDEIVTSPSPQPQNGNKDSLSHTPNKRDE